jgi:hypothetical protein
MLGPRAWQGPLQPESAGQCVVFAGAVGGSERFRPQGWEESYAKLLRHEVGFVREVAVESLPLPAPEPLRKLLPGLITDPDLDVQIAARRVAEKVKGPELKQPVLRALAGAKEMWQFRTASSAALALDARWERLEVIVGRMDDPQMTALCLQELVYDVLKNPGGWSGPSEKWTAEEARACKARWVKFLREHGKELRDGKQFPRNDPAITPDLFPTMVLGL